MATTEPVADYLLQAAGLNNLTPWPFQADVMNGVDPPAQDVSLEQGFFTQHKVKVFIYNQQVTNSLTSRCCTLAHAERDTGGRRLRDHAHPRLRLPDLDDGGGQRR